MRKIYEDKDLLAFEKPEGLLMHEGDKELNEKTFVSLLLESNPEQREMLSEYPLQNKTINLMGIAHRLDRDTSGLVLVARNKETLKILKEAFTLGNIAKEYAALVHGQINTSLTITTPLGREKKGFKRVPPNHVRARGPYLDATTDVFPLFYDDSKKVTRVKLIPHTGRTHQLRAHLSFIGHPIVGDKLYGSDEDKKAERLYLHATSITLPKGILEGKCFISEAPF